MSLTASQLAALAAMKIPVWQQRSGDIGPVSNKASLQLSKTLGIMLQDAGPIGAAEQRLFQAILQAFQLDLNQFEQLSSDHVPALLAMPESQLSVLVMGPCEELLNAATPLKSGALMLDNGIHLFVTDSLSDLLVAPARKAQLWQQGLAWLRAGAE